MLILYTHIIRQKNPPIPALIISKRVFHVKLSQTLFEDQQRMKKVVISSPLCVVLN